MHGIYQRVNSVFRTEGETPAVFVDRDGVVVEDPGYLCRVADIRYIEGALESIGALNRAGLPVVMVSNQAGVGRGYYGWAEFQNVQDAMEKELYACGAWLDGVWACGYHPDALVEGYRADNHTHRKPNPGMLQDAARTMNLSLRQSWMVGDKPCDIEAGLNAGVHAALHVETGYGKMVRNELTSRFGSFDRVRFCSNLREAATLILEEHTTTTINAKT